MTIEPGWDRRRIQLGMSEKLETLVKMTFMESSRPYPASPEWLVGVAQYSRTGELVSRQAGWFMERPGSSEISFSGTEPITVRFPPLPGFEAIPPLVLDADPGQTRATTVELVPVDG